MMNLNASYSVETSGIMLSPEGINSDVFFNELHKLIDELPSNGGDMFSPFPVLIKESSLAESQYLCAVLENALKVIVKNYFNDERIREVYQLDPQLESVLKLAEGRPYSVGMFRPDFLYDKTGQAKICEIGCRYPINGWMFSYYMNQLVDKVSSELSSNWCSVPDQTRFISTLSDTFKEQDCIFWVHLKEPGTEINYLIDEWAKLGIRVLSVTPDELQVLNKQIYTKEGQTSQHFILELDREELRQFAPNVLKTMVENGACINDVRSLILVHDKRVLTALYDEDIMRDYLCAEEYEFLKPFLIPSFTLNESQKRTELMGDAGNWVLKKNSGGRGVGMLVKNDCSDQEWQKTIKEQHSNYMIQKYVDQQQFDFKNGSKGLTVNVVGMLLCYNSESFGPGIFRASSESIINVHQGRGFILPCVIQSGQTA